MRKARRRTQRRRVIDQRSVQISQGTKPKNFLQRDHVINLRLGRKGIGRAKDHLSVDMANHMCGNDHEARAPRETGTGQEVEVLEEVGHVAEVQEKTKTDHGVGVLEEVDREAGAPGETGIGHGVGVPKGKDIEAEAQEKTGTDHKVPTKKMMLSEDILN